MRIYKLSSDQWAVDGREFLPSGKCYYSRSEDNRISIRLLGDQFEIASAHLSELRREDGSYYNSLATFLVETRGLFANTGDKTSSGGEIKAFYYDAVNSIWVLEYVDGKEKIEVAGTCSVEFEGNNVVLFRGNIVVGYGLITNIEKNSGGGLYVDKTEFISATSNFFVKAPLGGGDIESLESIYAYGVRLNLDASATTLTRVGNLALHVSLPIQQGMRGCLLNDDGSINYYLHPTDWTKKADGSNSDLTGAHGQVMVRVPRHFRKFYPDGGSFTCMLSTRQLPGYEEVKEFFIGAYHAALQRSTSKLASVKNTTADYRGGNNTSAWDAEARTLLGKPATNISLTNYRTHARARKAGSVEWNVTPYEQRKTLVWLYYVEYANLQAQAAVAGKDGSGYSSGGLGNGVTTADGTQWNNFNGYNPFINCGATDSLGNGTGEVSVVVTNFGGAGVNRTFTANRWRGIENIFGHIWEHGDGCLIDIKSDADGGTSKAYTVSDPANFSSVSFANYTQRGNIPRVENWIRNLILGANGDILPSVAGGAGTGSNAFFCDYNYTFVASSSLRTIIWAGNATTGSTAGLVCAHSSFSPSHAYTHFGARLCFVPA